jgi:antitoxin MazE
LTSFFSNAHPIKLSTFNQAEPVPENSIIELIETKDALIINKKQKVSTLDELLTSIPEDFQYPDDIIDFVESQALGQEII